jgi:hypothetical protein
MNGIVNYGNEEMENRVEGLVLYVTIDQINKVTLQDPTGLLAEYLKVAWDLLIFP